MHFRLEHRVGTVDKNVASLRERQAQLRLQPRNLAPFPSPGASVPHLKRHVLVEAIGVTDDEDAMVPM